MKRKYLRYLMSVVDKSIASCRNNISWYELQQATTASRDEYKLLKDGKKKQEEEIRKLKLVRKAIDREISQIAINEKIQQFEKERKKWK